MVHSNRIGLVALGGPTLAVEPQLGREVTVPDHERAHGPARVGVEPDPRVTGLVGQCFQCAQLALGRHRVEHLEGRRETPQVGIHPTLWGQVCRERGQLVRDGPTCREVVRSPAGEQPRVERLGMQVSVTGGARFGERPHGERASPSGLTGIRPDPGERTPDPGARRRVGALEHLVQQRGQRARLEVELHLGREVEGDGSHCLDVTAGARRVVALVAAGLARDVHGLTLEGRHPGAGGPAHVDPTPRAGRSSRLRTRQVDHAGMLCDAGRVPVTGAVDAEIDDAAGVDISAHEFAAIPLLPAVVPELLDLEEEATG